MNIVNRPVTNHGLVGIKGLNAGPGIFLNSNFKHKWFLYIFFMIYLLIFVRKTSSR